VVRDVADLAVFHDDDQLVQREIGLFVGNNMLMIEVLQQVDLEHGRLLFLLLEAAQHDLFGDVSFVFCAVSHEPRRTKVAAAHQL
jgi:hypothetical protein